MSTTISAISIDTADAAALAAFWAGVLGRPVNPGATADYAAIDAADPAGDPSADPTGGPKVTFHKVPELTTARNRVRLGLRTDRYEAESQRLVDLGAEALGAYEKPSLRWTTFADPEGNEFDLVTVRPTE